MPFVLKTEKSANLKFSGGCEQAVQRAVPAKRVLAQK
jgi:hypothetical protein